MMRRRSEAPIGQTLVHGDVNPGNVLVPRAANDRIFFIDRQPFDWSLTTWMGVSDLACASLLD